MRQLKGGGGDISAIGGERGRSRFSLMADGWWLLLLEAGWEALKDKGAGPTHHSGAAKELKRSESHSGSRTIWAHQ